MTCGRETLGSVQVNGMVSQEEVKGVQVDGVVSQGKAG